MITKITEANDQEYYAPRFAYITEQLAAREDLPSVVIDSVEAYFANIDYIKQLYSKEDGSNAGYLLLVAPADEEYFNIDANARTIAIPAAFKKNGVGVYGDHQAEMLVFKIDRYFDYQDLYNTKIAINWNFTPAGSRAPFYEVTQSQEALFPNDVLEPGYLTFGFLITQEMTKNKKGILNLSVTFYELTNDQFAYSLNTQTIALAINDGLTLENPAEIKNHSSSLLDRLRNSAYTPDGVEPIVTPIWRTGDMLDDEYLGLFNEVNFDMNEDGSEPATLDLQAQAYSAGHLGSMNYTWYANEDDISAIGTGLVGGVRKLTDLPENWAGERELALFNQNAIIVNQKGDVIVIRGNLAALNETQSSNPNQGIHKWIAIDIETRAESIEQVSWNGSALSAEDVADSASVGLEANHIIFWAKADELIDNPREITLSADGFEPVTLQFSFSEEDKVTKPSDYIFAFVKNGNDQFVENHTYFAKNELGVIDTANPINSQEALNTFNDEDHVEIYELGSAYTVYGAGKYQVKAQATKIISNGSSYFSVNSDVVDSNMCVIPPAVEPAVTVQVESSFKLPENCIIENAKISEDSDLEYTYIAANAAPRITAVVSSVEENKKLGAVALELLASDEISELTKEKIESGNYSFTKVDAESGTFNMNENNAVQEDDYQVRAINYKNHTYSVSEPSKKIVTAFVAPIINNIDVTYSYYHDGRTDDVPVIQAGASVPSTPYQYSTITLSNEYPSFVFTITDKTEGNYPEAVTTYVVEEGEMVQGEFVPLPQFIEKTIDGEKQLVPNPDIAWEALEVSKDVTGKLTFTIGSTAEELRDTGWFRIKTINRYKGTAQTAYTGRFLVSKQES